MDKIDNSIFKILIVDDMPKNIQLLGTILREERYDIYFANSGKGALQKVEETVFDLILLDIMMPEMNGYEVCEILKSNENTKDIPVIFLTANVGTDNVVEGFKYGAADYITKPFDTRELLSRVKTHIQLKHAKDEIMKQNEKMRFEMEIAKMVHSKMVNFDLPTLKNFNLYVDNISIGGIGGDFIEIINIDEKHIGIFFADVSGHGVSAALTISALKFVIISNFKNYYKPSEALFMLNEAITSTFLGEGITLSAIYVVLNLDTGETIVSAGAQEDMVLITENGAKHDFKKGILLGIADNEFIREDERIAFSDTKLELNSKDKLFFYTDGMVEADFMTREHFFEILDSFKDKSGKEIVEYFDINFKPKLLKDEKDDTTYLIVERK